MSRYKKQPIPVISVLLVFGFLLTTLTSYFVSRRSLRSEIAQSELPLTSDNVYSEIQRDLLRPVLISSVMASDTFLRQWVLDGEQDPARIEQYLKEIKQRYGAFSSFFVSERTRRYYYADGILKTVSPDEERDIWYFRVRQMAEPYEINVDPDLANDDAMTIFVNYRVYDYAGNYIGATGIGLTVDAVRALIEDLQARYERTVFFIDDAGNVRLAGQQFPKEVSNVFEAPFYAGFAQEMGAAAESAFSYRRQGDTVHVNVRYIPEFHWYLVVEQAEGRVTRQVFSALLVNLLVCFIITLIVLILVRLTVKGYQESIATLSGIVPICSFCKKIRDDKGYWNQVEAYVAQHSEAEFSHGICPECMAKHYPEIMEDDDEAPSGHH